jgi:hypothetical protein
MRSILEYRTHAPAAAFATHVQLNCHHGVFAKLGMPAKSSYKLLLHYNRYLGVTDKAVPCATPSCFLANHDALDPPRHDHKM